MSAHTELLAGSRKYNVTELWFFNDVRGGCIAIGIERQLGV